MRCLVHAWGAWQPLDECHQSRLCSRCRNCQTREDHAFPALPPSEHLDRTEDGGYSGMSGTRTYVRRGSELWWIEEGMHYVVDWERPYDAGPYRAEGRAQDQGCLRCGAGSFVEPKAL